MYRNRFLLLVPESRTRQFPVRLQPCLYHCLRSSSPCPVHSSCPQSLRMCNILICLQFIIQMWWQIYKFSDGCTGTIKNSIASEYWKVIQGSSVIMSDLWRLCPVFKYLLYVQENHNLIILMWFWFFVQWQQHNGVETNCSTYRHFSILFWNAVMCAAHCVVSEEGKCAGGGVSLSVME